MLKEYKLRSMFIAPKDHVLISWDLKQAESWCVAYFANEPTMKEELAHGDIHSHTAAAIYHELKELMRKDKKKRYVGKQSNHMLAYRASPYRLVQTINKESDGLVSISNKEGFDIAGIWHGLYHLENWWSQIEFDLDQNGRTLVTPYGRVRTFFEAWGKELFKQATAHLAQSTAADHFNGALHPDLNILGGLIEVHKQFVETNALRIVNTAHDSLVAEVHKDVAQHVIEPVTKLIGRPLIINQEQFTIPVECEIGERWGEMEVA